MLSRAHTIFGISVAIWIGMFGGVQAQQTSIQIAKIVVTGNERAEASLILRLSGLSEGMRLTPESVGNAIRSLYALGLFSDVRVYAEEELEGGAIVEIVVEELPSLRKLAFEGNRKIKKEELSDELGFMEGQVVGPKEIRDAEREILRMYEDKGYHLAKARGDVSDPDGEGRVTITFHIEEGQRVQVRRIRISGNEAIEISKIRKGMETKEDRWWRGGDFKEEVYREDLERILALYRREGYRDAEIVGDSLYYSSSKKDLFIDIAIEEGIQYRFGKISWEGNELLSDQTLTEKMEIREEESFNEDKLALTRYNIETEYQERGYLAARAIPRMTLEGETIGLHFQLMEGVPSKVRLVNIEGNTRTKERVIRRELLIKPGQVFKRSALDRSRRDVYLLNFFSKVDVEPSPPDEDGGIDLTFRVEERSTGMASMGAGYSGRDKLVGTIGLSIPNLFGNGQQLDFNWDFGSRRETFYLSFSEPWLFGTPTSGSVSMYHTTRSYLGYYDYRRRGGSLSMGRRLSWPDTYSRASVQYRLEEVKYFNFDADYEGPVREEQSWTTSSFGGRYVRDTRDMPQFPTRGALLSYRPEIASTVLAGNANFQKHLLDASLYFPTFWKFVLNLTARAGVVKSFGDSEDVPSIEKFTPGGVDFDGMIRGYSDQSVGPRGEGNFPVGGRSLLVFNLEYRFPITEQQLYGLAFIDAGNAWEWTSDMRLFDLRYSAGIGFRLVAHMLGTIGFDFAYGFDRRKVDGQPAQWKIHFQFGPQFNY